MCDTGVAGMADRHRDVVVAYAWCRVRVVTSVHVKSGVHRLLFV